MEMIRNWSLKEKVNRSLHTSKRLDSLSLTQVEDESSFKIIRLDSQPNATTNKPLQAPKPKKYNFTRRNKRPTFVQTRNRLSTASFNLNALAFSQTLRRTLDDKTSLIRAVSLPTDVSGKTNEERLDEENEFLAELVGDLYHDTEQLYMLLSDSNQKWEEACFSEEENYGFPIGVKYLIKRSKKQLMLHTNMVKETHADVYASHALDQVLDVLSDPTIFPVFEYESFPVDFKSSLKLVLKLLLRVCLIINANNCLLDKEKELESVFETHLRLLLYFGWTWNLLPDAEVKVLGSKAKVLKAKFDNDKRKLKIREQNQKSGEHNWRLSVRAATRVSADIESRQITEPDFYLPKMQSKRESKSKRQSGDADSDTPGEMDFLDFI